jgi:5-methylcytosine-specific restriction endonuclease McrA
MFKNANPMCADPFGVHAKDGIAVPGTEVDHIIARAAGGTDAWENLQNLCTSCHSRKTVECDGGFGRARKRMS